MGIPSYGYNHRDVFTGAGQILNLCKELDVDTVAGPATSGVVIAMACFMRSRRWKRSIKAMLLEKRGYERAKHNPGPKLLGEGPVKNILVVDDCVASGESFLHAINEAERSVYGGRVVACATSTWWRSAVDLILDRFPWMKFYSVGKSVAEYKRNQGNYRGVTL